MSEPSRDSNGGDVAGEGAETIPDEPGSNRRNPIGRTPGQRRAARRRRRRQVPHFARQARLRKI